MKLIIDTDKLPDDWYRELGCPGKHGRDGDCPTTEDDTCLDCWIQFGNGEIRSMTPAEQKPTEIESLHSQITDLTLQLAERTLERDRQRGVIQKILDLTGEPILSGNLRIEYTPMEFPFPEIGEGTDNDRKRGGNE